MIPFVDTHRGTFGVEPICRELQVAPSSYYAAKSRPRSARLVSDATLAEVIGRVHRANFGVYGIRKVWKSLRRLGVEAGRDAIADAIGTLPEQLRRSLTWDQGAEMAQHAQLRIDAGVAIYFCDPRSPWQRGSNENTNGLLRQYFPKGTDLARHSRADLDAVALALNTRPRKTLAWKTPAEALDDVLHSTGQGRVARTG